MKRKVRERSEETKRKISESLKGRKKTEEHKQAISMALKKYWVTVPNAEDNEYIIVLND